MEKILFSQFWIGRYFYCQLKTTEPTYIWPIWPRLVNLMLSQGQVLWGHNLWPQCYTGLAATKTYISKIWRFNELQAMHNARWLTTLCTFLDCMLLVTWAASIQQSLAHNGDTQLEDSGSRRTLTLTTAVTACATQRRCLCRAIKQAAVYIHLDHSCYVTSLQWIMYPISISNFYYLPIKT